MTRTGAPRAAAHSCGRRRWVEGPNGHTFAILPGPLEFRMGSPPRLLEPTSKNVTIGGSVARSRATTEVTIAQFRAYKAEGPPAREPGVVAGHITWYDAAGYCARLRAQAGIDRTQWCCPEEVKPGFTLAADALEKAGYRLPTEAEWNTSAGPVRRRAGRSAGRTRSYPGTPDLVELGDQARPPGRPCPASSASSTRSGTSSSGATTARRTSTRRTRTPTRRGPPTGPPPTSLPRTTANGATCEAGPTETPRPKHDRHTETKAPRRKGSTPGDSGS
ncbi:MAG: SUMF1/EgtB/PvdO family nonheme iron enzyme [Singulisphaera sp.]